mmetsp:Transcript_22266/g.48942  ORF Transcript_22266/g.48942 Transcript_22266/m.48942 type:complete len:293 (+) Transcript_22266:1307-2185(+)
MERNAPMKTPSCTAPPASFASVPHTNISSRACNRPPMMATPNTCRSLATENSTPSEKSMKTIPNCASVSTCTSSLISAKPPGPHRLPARRYPVITGCPKEAKMTPPMAAHTIITTRSEMKRKSCCNSMFPFFGLDMTNSLSSASMSRATSSCSYSEFLLIPSALSICVAVSSMLARIDSALVGFFAVSFPVPAGGGDVREARLSCVTRATVSSTAFSVCNVSLKLRPADPSSLSSGNSFSNAFSNCPAMESSLYRESFVVGSTGIKTPSGVPSPAGSFTSTTPCCSPFAALT